MSRQLVIGASGQVGEHLIRALSASGLDAVGTYYSHAIPGLRELDVRDTGNVHALIEMIRPEVIYVPASLTNVDYCELHPEEAYAANVVGVRNVVAATNEVGARLVFFSSDYVFDGKSGSYREDDLPAPICEYGRQKVLAEQHVSLQARDYLIVRTAVVYGWERQGKNFVYRLTDALRCGRTIQAPIDQVGSPTYAPNLARAVVELALSDASGVYHVAGPEQVNRYDFARVAAEVFGLDSRLIQPVATSELGQAAARPLNAGLAVEKAAERLTVELSGYRDGLRAMAAQPMQPA